VRARLTQRGHGGEHGGTSGRCVLYGQHPAPGNLGAFDPALQPVRLVGLADHKSVQNSSLNGRGVHHRGRYRIGAQGEPAYGVVVEAGCCRQHHPAGQRRAAAAQQDPAQVDVPGRALSRGEYEVAPHHGFVLDHAQQVISVGHELQRNRACSPLPRRGRWARAWLAGSSLAGRT